MTYARLPAGLIAIDSSVPPGTGIVATTVLVAVLITKTVLAMVLLTYANVPAGLTATSSGAEPTGMVDHRIRSRI